ncbi:glycerol-3-phosphate dehydrogenase [Alphaproteobacteria bacterium HT1-32]|nr:glycerol-3-phosphate dehydrogenase [Alphaproteobacteria bacterium HT1-32]
MPDTQTDVDIFIIGGGINGCGIARDAAGRGFRVAVAEMNDLASGTSSWSTKLVHGGLRYLEHYEFRLVREALKEREVLWKMAPHIIWPLRFVLPHHKDLRPAWLLRLGLFIYDHLGGRKLLPATRTLDMTRDITAQPLKPLFSRGFEYSDCWVDDARLVALNAQDAADRGAQIRTRTKVTSARRENGMWNIHTLDRATGTETVTTARLLVNASGPWVDQVLSGAAGWDKAQNVRLVQGSHIVVRKMFDHDRCYIFQNADGRIIFAIPYQQDFTLLGTTDHDFSGDPAKAAITAEETDYLCRAASDYFRQAVTPDDIVWTYAGVRPLFDDGASKAQEATRDYVLREEGSTSEGILINIFGGKITTYRRLAESVLEKIEQALGQRQPAWTATSTLPGGDFPATGFEALHRDFMTSFPFLEPDHARRLLRQYGTNARTIIGEARSASDLGQHFGADLYQAEVDYLTAREWARTAEDILWRRTKLGLITDEADHIRLQDYLSQREQLSVSGRMAAN